MDKHNLIIVLLAILFIGSVSFSAYLIASGDSAGDTPKADTNSDLERAQLLQEKAAWEAEKAALKEKLAETEAKVPLLEVDKASPFDHVKSHRVNVFKSKVEIDVQDISHWTIADTNSMDPVLDIGSTALSIKPSSPAEIYVGDIAFYDSLIAKRAIVHRIIATNDDAEGWYSTFKGDNLVKQDPEKVRFPQIAGVLIGVIY